MGRFFFCLVVAWSCIALLAPVHGRVGLASGLVGKIRPVSAPRFHVIERRGVRAGSSWSSTSRSLAAAAAAAELRSVPAGPDPMHHHGSPRRPEHDVP